MMDDIEAQKDEILVLQSIFDESQIHVTCSSGQDIVGCIHIKPVNEKLNIQANKDGLLQQFSVEHLCPIELHFNIPLNYPSVRPPNFTLVCKWLRRDQLSKLCQKLDQIWEDVKGQVVLFEWVQFLQNEVLEYLEIQNTLDLSWAYNSSGKVARLSCSSHAEAQQSPAVPNRSKPNLLDSRAVSDNQFKGDLLEFLKEYEQISEQAEFEKTSHTCKVCFGEKMGSTCTRFPTCNHVYCKECMRSYFEIKIADGMVNGMHCPEDKCTSQASPGQVKELVSVDSFVRYDSLLLESTIASMLNLTYCPRSQCQYPVSYEPESNLVSCPYCNFHFCLMCKATYHGVAPCKMTPEEKMKIFETYTNGDQPTKESMERKYGKKQLLSMINDIQAETWIGQNSKPCPHCSAPIEKKDGCNKMSCPRCNTFFCWLCLSQLDPRCPYLHFSNAKARCNLFEGLIQDGDDREDWININHDFEDDFSDDEIDLDEL